MTNFQINTQYTAIDKQYNIVWPMTVKKRTAKFITIEIPTTYNHPQRDPSQPEFEDYETKKIKIDKLGNVENFVTRDNIHFTIFMPGFVSSVSSLYFIALNQA